MQVENGKTMKEKTQIFGLINGRKEVIRDENCGKYIHAERATSHIGYAGTDHKTRMAIAEKVIAENPNGLNITIRGIGLHLDKHTTTSGKTVWYSRRISEPLAISIIGLSQPQYEYERDWDLAIDGDMVVTITVYARKTPKSEWKARHTYYVGEEFVRIL